jgi:hypothetical protein
MCENCWILVGKNLRLSCGTQIEGKKNRVQWEKTWLSCGTQIERKKNRQAGNICPKTIEESEGGKLLLNFGVLSAGYAQTQLCRY